MYKLPIMSDPGCYFKEDGKWTFLNGEKEWDVDNEDVEYELFLYQQADPDINSTCPPDDYISYPGIDLNRTDEEDVQKINNWLESL